MKLAAANHNFPAAKPGESFHPEMGETHDGTALFLSQHGYNSIYLSWSTARHADALAAFKKLRIRPSNQQLSEMVRGGHKWTATVTYKAHRKLLSAKLAVIELLLD